MPLHRLVIYRHDRLLGQFDSTTPDSLQATRDIAARLPAEEGYRFELFVADGERRLIEAGPEGIRTLGSTPIFVRGSLDT